MYLVLRSTEDPSSLMPAVRKAVHDVDPARLYAWESGAPQADIARNGITLKAGEKVAGVIVTIADGASGMSGTVVPATEGARPPARLRIHLVPAEVSDANDVLRYAEAFSLRNYLETLNGGEPSGSWVGFRF